MLMRKLGRTGLKVAALCLGGNTFGWTTDQKASEAVLDAYVDAGVNFIDTADCYPVPPTPETAGKTEEIIGGWLAAASATASCWRPSAAIRTGPELNDEGLSRRPHPAPSRTA